LGRAAAVDGAAGAEEHLERHAVADKALAERAMRMRVRVDEARDEQAVLRIDDLGIFRRGGIGGQHALDRALRDDELRTFGKAALDVENSAAADEDRKST